jgi:hypothetical protein
MSTHVIRSESSRSAIPASRLRYAVQGIFLGAAIVSIAFVIFLCLNHLWFPLHIDLMEGTVLQHVQQVVEGKPIYPEPTPAYVPLAYNPLYYILSALFVKILGLSVSTLRFVSCLALAGSGILIYLTVREKTASKWWGMIAAGLFAAAFHVMDMYLDTAHSDAWFLFTALLGTFIIDRARSKGWNLVGVLVLIASFWFKQHGALFVVGGLLFLTWRDGARPSFVYWLAAALLGPALYIFAGPALFGPYFHYFTWTVPRSWSKLDMGTLKRYLGFIVESYPVLALSGTLLAVSTALRERKNLSIWHVQFGFALLTGLMGSLDAGSSDNVYIPMGAWFIVVGVWGLYSLTRRFTDNRRYAVILVALALTFILFVYDLGHVLVSPSAQASYDDLITTLNSLDGTVYAPTIGQLPGVYTFYPAAHWVALEDMIRGPGRDTANNPNTRKLLEPALNPTGPAYILSNFPLEDNKLLGFLMEKYVLDTDYGDRFKPLHILPKRYNHLWPRYLYRYDPEAAAQSG